MVIMPEMDIIEMDFDSRIFQRSGNDPEIDLTCAIYTKQAQQFCEKWKNDIFY